MHTWLTLYTKTKVRYLEEEIYRANIWSEVIAKLYFHFENKGPFQGIKYISYFNFMKFDRNIKTRTVELCSSQYLGYNFI